MAAAPGFRAVEDNDFSLLPGSAAVDKGLHIPNISDGWKGVRGAAPDIGALELGESNVIRKEPPPPAEIAAEPALPETPPAASPLPVRRTSASSVEPQTGAPVEVAAPVEPSQKPAEAATPSATRREAPRVAAEGLSAAAQAGVSRGELVAWVACALVLNLTITLALTRRRVEARRSARR